MKNSNNLSAKNGITLLTLVITIVVILILASVIVFESNDIIGKTRKSEFAKEIYTIQNLVKQYKFKNNSYPISGNVNISLNDLDPDYVSQFSNEPNYSSGNIILSTLDLYEADVENTVRGNKKNSNEKDIYLVSESTGIVYYLAGQTISGNVYYTLTDELKDIIGK